VTMAKGNPARSVAAAGLGADHPVPEARPVLVAPLFSNEVNTIRVSLQPVACWRLEDIRFDFDSSFIRPDAAEELGALATLRHIHPGAPISIFGHADPVGNDVYNKRLSGRRAAAIYGALVRDADIWEKLYQDGEDHWGIVSIQQMLQATGHPPGMIDGMDGPKTRAAVREFQGTVGLEDDGIAGPKTRRELFLAYMDVICRDEDGEPYRKGEEDITKKISKLTPFGGFLTPINKVRK